jgi:hypothetical protein
MLDTSPISSVASTGPRIGLRRLRNVQPNADLVAAQLSEEDLAALE